MDAGGRGPWGGEAFLSVGSTLGEELLGQREAPRSALRGGAGSSFSPSSGAGRRLRRV